MPKLSVICYQCGKEFYRERRKIKKYNFCSIECSGKNRRKRMKINCSYCGKEFEILINKYINSRNKKFFCVRKCKDNAQRLNSDNPCLEIRPKHYGTGTNINYRDLAISNNGARCERCGYEENINGLVVHHRNKNREDNNLGNLEVLCGTCHLIEHYS